MQNIFVKYRSKLSFILENLSIEIKENEKIGIVGRTGAGKSTIILALLRLLELNQGKIMIDGVDISKIPLERLRQSITVIPQDPTLFGKTLRQILDPLQNTNDSQKIAALKKVKLWQKFHNLNGLETRVFLPTFYQSFQVLSENSNLSIGEKQLICIARSFLENTKIVLMDEATSSVDIKTDQLIQSAVSSCFKNATVIIIAHKLNTIMDMDRILVLDKGKKVEFDSPQNLLKDQASFFYGYWKKYIDEGENNIYQIQLQQIH